MISNAKNYFSNSFFIFNKFWLRSKNIPFIETPLKNEYTYETIIDGIDVPWGMAFISKNELLVTEISGLLYRVKNGKKTKVKGLPYIYTRGQGGLLDLALHPDFKKNNIIYMTLATNTENDNKGGNTALYCGKLEGLIT